LELLAPLGTQDLQVQLVQLELQAILALLVHKEILEQQAILVLQVQQVILV
jgi:hypothetical protein